MLRGCSLLFLATLSTCTVAAGLDELEFLGAGGDAGGGAGGGAGAGGEAKPAVCGDGVIDSGEECDDQNAINGDRCEDCMVECDVENEVTHSCYEVVAGSFSYAAGITECAQRGGHLATVTSQDELNIVAPLHDEPAVLGASVIEQNGPFQWITDEPWAFESWGSGQPDGDFDECLSLYSDNAFHDWPCDNGDAIICEYEPAGTHATPPCHPPAFSDPSTGQCYTLVLERRYSRVAQACSAWGGYVASLSLTDEVDFLFDNVLVEAWVGAERQPDDTWSWLNGEPFDSGIWALGEPSGSGSCARWLPAQRRIASTACAPQFAGLCER